MTGKLSKNFHGVGIGPLSKILAVKYVQSYYQILCRQIKISGFLNDYDCKYFGLSRQNNRGATFEMYRKISDNTCRPFTHESNLTSSKIL